MSLSQVYRHVASHAACSRSSYLEISRFFRTRHHGILTPRTAICLKEASRFFSNSRIQRDVIEPDEKLRKTLDDFKAAIAAGSLVTSKSPFTSKQQNFTSEGEEVTHCGYLSTRRDVNKNLSFTMLTTTNLGSCIQLVSNSNEGGTGADAHVLLRSLKEWTPVFVRGKLKSRNAAKSDKHLGMTLITDKEIALEEIVPLNRLSDDLIIKSDTVFGPEQRHLQLRTDHELRQSLLFRAKAVRIARDHLAVQHWSEIETPVLFKSTPEGAREFLVPTRQKGLAYALPQSPQQYKQILMASGITKYFQFAKCFRDEDLRADRQPEFTQLDMERSFAAEGDIKAEIEALVKILWSQLLQVQLPDKLPEMTYYEAMALYGSDKPDLRFKAKIYNITEHLPQDLIGKITPLQDSVIDGCRISISDDPQVTRDFISQFLETPDGKPYLDNPNGQPGIFVGDHSKPMQGLGPLGYPFVMEGPESLQTENGDLLILQARPNAPLSGGSTVLGNLRLAIHKAAIAQGLMPAPAASTFEFLWITDFPLFTPNNDSDPGQGGSAGFSSTHHPFTAPKTPEDVELLLTDPSRAIAAHYDLVVNGVELGGGSRRIHNAAMQEFIFRDVLKMNPDRIEDFRHLLDALASGCPPHAGIALGWDRLIAVMRGKESVRDVIAFPKSGRGEDGMVRSPNRVTEEQWDTYHLRVKE